MWYIRNQKVASQAVVSHLRSGAAGFARGQMQSYLLPYGLHGFPKRERGDFTFSVIREPMEAARAAYLEVSRRRAGAAPAQRLSSSRQARGGDGGGVGGMSYRSLPCAAGPRSAERTAERYLAFLHDVERGSDLGTETFHAYPQALKLSVASWMDAFVRLERLGADGPFSGQRLMHRSGISLPSMHAAAPKHVTASTRRDACAFNITARLERVMCRFYQADYACLPYELPRACRSSSPSSEITSEISTPEISPSERTSEISTDDKRFLSVVGTSAQQGTGSTVIPGARTRAIGPSATTRTFEVGGVLYATSLA